MLNVTTLFASFSLVCLNTWTDLYCLFSISRELERLERSESISDDKHNFKAKGKLLNITCIVKII